MTSDKNSRLDKKLHPRNKNLVNYDLDALIKVNPALAEYIRPNKYGNNSVDFANPLAVKILNKAILNHYYGIKYWDFPDQNLCPPIPGRADYLHYIADLLAENNLGKIPKGDGISCLDIGMGASCIYPIIGVVEYDWSFIGTDIDVKSIDSAEKIINTNESLKGRIICKLQKDPQSIFKGIINENDKIDIAICNPPFHSSVEEAQKGSRRKIKNLSGKKVKTPRLNFSGVTKELITEGGEHGFIQKIIEESKVFSKNFYRFSSLVSKQSNLKDIYDLLEKMTARDIQTIPIGTGNKKSRIVTWTFLTKKEQEEWRESRWKSK